MKPTGRSITIHLVAKDESSAAPFTALGDADHDKYGLSAGAVAGDVVFAATMALDFDKLERKQEAETIADETRICLEELESVLARAGCTLRDVVKTTCYLSDESYRMEFVGAYQQVFDPGPYPARTTLTVGIAGDCRVEIDAVAIRPPEPGPGESKAS